MSELSNRCIEIINIILNTDGYVRIRDIADKLDVSVRTVKYDLDRIRWWMEENGFELSSLPKKGVMINHDFKPALKEMLESDDNDCFFSAQERVYNLVYYFLTSYRGESLDEIAQQCRISKNTMLRDMDKVEKWFIDHNAIMIRRQKKGVLLKLNEEDSRRLLVEFIVENKNIDETIEYYVFKPSLSNTNQNLLEIEKRLIEK